MTREEALAFINAAGLEVGPACGDPWFIECSNKLMESIDENKTDREKPPEYYIEKEKNEEEANT